MSEAFICDYIRTPIGRFGGSLSSVRADDLGAVPLKELAVRNPSIDFEAVDEVIYGCANQAGEDNRNVARMAALLAGFPKEVSGITLNRLCASGLEAVNLAAKSITVGEGDIIIGGGVESMSRAPWSVPKPERPQPMGHVQMWDTTIGWRYDNPKMDGLYPLISLGETAERIAIQFTDAVFIQPPKVRAQV